MRAPHCEVHIFDPTLDPSEVQEVEAVDRVKFHDFGLGAKDQRVWRSSTGSVPGFPVFNQKPCPRLLSFYVVRTIFTDMQIHCMQVHMPNVSSDRAHRISANGVCR